MPSLTVSCRDESSLRSRKSMNAPDSSSMRDSVARFRPVMGSGSDSQFLIPGGGRVGERGLGEASDIMATTTLGAADQRVLMTSISIGGKGDGGPLPKITVSRTL